MNAGIKRNYSFENEKYREKLTKQVLHMDQGVAYNPEYRASRVMSLYPSRVAQVIEAVLEGKLKPSKRGADLVFASILSGQGERWQNFSENPGDFLHCAILGRELFVNAGFVGSSKRVEIFPSPERESLWTSSIEITANGDYLLFVDDASYEYTKEAPRKLGEFLKHRDIRLRGRVAGSTGFALLAQGRVEDGIKRLTALVEELNANGAKKILTLSGQATYALTVLADEFELPRQFETVDILDVADGIEAKKAHVYAGSFYSRFLKKSHRLAELTPNQIETPVLNAPEFVPLFDADRRVNGLGIWASPICPEYAGYGDELGLLQGIRDAALAEIDRSSFSQLIVCDPFAYRELEKVAAGKLVYFWNLLR